MPTPHIVQLVPSSIPLVVKWEPGVHTPNPVVCLALVEELCAEGTERFIMPVILDENGWFVIPEYFQGPDGKAVDWYVEPGSL